MKDRRRSENHRRLSALESLERRLVLAGLGVDLNFGGSGVATADVGGSASGDLAVDAAVQSDGKTLVAIGPDYVGGSHTFAVARFNPDGSPDGSFGTAGIARYTDSLPVYETSMIVQADGKIVVAGYDRTYQASNSTYYPHPLMCRFDTEGRLDSTFGSNGIVLLSDGALTDIASLPDGRLLTSGSYFDRPSMWQFDADGHPDPTYGVSGRADLGTGFSIRSGFDAANDGTVLIMTSGGVKRISATGAVLQSLSNVTGEAWARQSDGRFIVASGVFPQPRNILVKRFNTDGAADITFGTGGSTTLDFFGADDYNPRLLVRGDDSILVGATSYVSIQPPATNTGYDFSLARLTPSGMLDPTFGIGGRFTDVFYEGPYFSSADTLTALREAPDHSVLAIGTTSIGDGVNDNGGVRRYVLDSPADLQPGGPYISDEGSLFDVSAAGSTYPGGSFTTYQWQYGFGGRLFTSPVNGQTAQLLCTDDGPKSGIIVALRATSSNGLQFTKWTTVDSQNVPPTINPLTPRLAAAGASVSFPLTLSDRVAEVFSGTIDFGDGGAPVALSTPTGAVQSTSPVPSHTYTAPGKYTVVITVSDGDGGSATATTTVQVGDLAARVFQDDNGDGRLATTETPLAGYAVWVDYNRDGIRDPAEPQAVSNAAGDVMFNGIAPGSYALRIASVPAGWMLSTPDTDSAEAATGASTATGYFGFTQKGIVGGMVFNDLNGNGVRDPGESGLAGARISAYASDPFASGAVAASTGSSDSNGNFWIKALAPGTYSLSTIGSPIGFLQTSPAGRAVKIVTVAAAQRLTGADFGGVMGTAATISGIVFRDLDDNGVKGASDTTSIGQWLYIDANDNGVIDPEEYRTASGNGGKYSIGRLAAGSYVVRVALQPGWNLTSPGGDGAHRVAVTAGQSATAADFGGIGVARYYMYRSGDWSYLYAGTGPDGALLQQSNFISGSFLPAGVGDAGDDLFIIDYASGNPFGTASGWLNANGGTDTVRVLGTAANDAIAVSPTSVSIAGTSMSRSTFERLEVDGKRGWDAVNVNSGGSVTLVGPQQLQSLQIAATGNVAIATGAGMLLTRDLSLAAGSQLDLTDNSIAVDYDPPGSSPIGTWNGSAYSGITGLIQSGRNGGAWNGSGIVTGSANGNLTTLGVAEASQVLGISGSETGLFTGETVDATTVLVKFTYGGDANLDGKINVDDYGKLDSSAPLGISGWFNGDFNYDGKINVDDYGIIDFNVGIQGPPLGNGAAAATTLSASLAAAPNGQAREAVRWDAFVPGERHEDESLTDIL